jgi:hypothetical protein
VIATVLCDVLQSSTACLLPSLCDSVQPAIAAARFRKRFLIQLRLRSNVPTAVGGASMPTQLRALEARILSAYTARQNGVHPHMAFSRVWRSDKLVIGCKEEAYIEYLHISYICES